MLKNALKNWRTTVAGLATIASAAIQIHHAGDVAGQLPTILGGLGLIVASDSKKP